LRFRQQSIQAHRRQWRSIQQHRQLAGAGRGPDLDPTQGRNQSQPDHDRSPTKHLLVADSPLYATRRRRYRRLYFVETEIKGWLVVGGWWLVMELEFHQPPTSNHQPLTSYEKKYPDYPFDCGCRLRRHLLPRNQAWQTA